MARKDLLKGLIENAVQPASTGSKNEVDPAIKTDPSRPRYSGGAIGAVSQSIAHLKSRAIVDIDPELISYGGIADRLDDEDSDHEALVASIRDYGQQVPVLVRPHPEKEDHFQVVYGRRRVKALRTLQLPVKALVRTLDDRDLIVAQGQENSARKGLSFIEKASFARQMSEMGYDRKIICDTLHVDKTVISRMLAVAESVSPDLVSKIGSAPNIGRDRWLKLTELLAKQNLSDIDTITQAEGNSSDKRFEALFTFLNRGGTETKGSQPSPAALTLTTEANKPFATVQSKSNKTVLTILKEEAEGFDKWLVENISEIHRNWKNKSGE